MKKFYITYIAKFMECTFDLISLSFQSKFLKCFVEYQGKPTKKIEALSGS